MNNHTVQISQPYVDTLAWQYVLQILQHPELVRAKIDELRKQRKETLSKDDILSVLSQVKRSMKNLYGLCEASEDEEAVAEITLKLKELEKKKKDVLTMLSVWENDEEERLELEKEIQKFEQEASDFLTGMEFVPELSYERKRFAIHLLGLKVTVYPNTPDYPSRFECTMSVPSVLQKLYCSTIDVRINNKRKITVCTFFGV